jgi:hypothetical protein
MPLNSTSFKVGHTWHPPKRPRASNTELMRLKRRLVRALKEEYGPELTGSQLAYIDSAAEAGARLQLQPESAHPLAIANLMDAQRHALQALEGDWMKKIDVIDVTKINAEIFHRLGGIEGAVKYFKKHLSAFYPNVLKTQPQPMVQNNVAVSVSADDGEAARRHLEDAMIRLIAARKASVGDPAVYVNGERLYDDVPRLLTSDPPPSTRDIQPATDDASPGTADRGDVSLNESSTSPKPGTGFSREPAAASPGGGKKKLAQYSNSTVPLPRISFPGLASGAALDGSDDNRSTTQNYLEWPGHNRPPW